MATKPWAFNGWNMDFNLLLQGKKFAAFIYYERLLIIGCPNFTFIHDYFACKRKNGGKTISLKIRPNYKFSHWNCHRLIAGYVNCHNLVPNNLKIFALIHQFPWNGKTMSVYCVLPLTLVQMLQLPLQRRILIQNTMR